MQIVTAGRTGPNRSVRFGGDLSLDDRGCRDILALGKLAGTPSAGAPSAGAPSVGGPNVWAPCVCGPESATRESARLLAGHTGFAVDDGLRTLDTGAWVGRTPEEIDPGELGVWFADPAARPHGGESIEEFVRRVHAWRRSAGDTALAVVAMPVAQALLCVDAHGYFEVEVRPAAVYSAPQRCRRSAEDTQREETKSTRRT
ncbi:histidine phosphatase family protein [Gordonia jinghuaiqii]|uniref:Histidine phosphatase family protein n=1 Tax=Gordonia jinghuaiqii TaxID=2758710 RepID=A0A7D7LY49_9ACTN|nr:histidine phosphatase family protein [Gordonia jinghuaiqii]MCR5979978.1 histidine phosphatase family protein [Gordonia jinghuaiqii]QMT03175.1 histidine phosphatase family protein [Gordonia jinghuaiqii]